MKPNRINIEAYLKRINYCDSLAPNAETLCGLQTTHLLTVPFENLSIHAAEPIVLEPEALFEKIVERRRFLLRTERFVRRAARRFGF